MSFLTDRGSYHPVMLLLLLLFVCGGGSGGYYRSDHVDSTSEQLQNNFRTGYENKKNCYVTSQSIQTKREKAGLHHGVEAGLHHGHCPEQVQNTV